MILRVLFHFILDCIIYQVLLAVMKRFCAVIKGSVLMKLHQYAMISTIVETDLMKQHVKVNLIYSSESQSDLEIDYLHGIIKVYNE